MSIKAVLAVTAMVYLAAVIFCAVRVLGYDDTEWLLILVALTLPWSLVSVVFIWSLIHGASLGLFWFIYLGAGATNAFLFYRYLPRLYARLRRWAA